MKNINLQVQSVLYKTEKKDIFRSLESRIAAAKYAGIDLTLAFGDASPQPLFTDGEIDELKSKYHQDAKLTYEFFDENTGHGRGQNLLARNKKSGYLMFLNPDVVIAPDAFSELLKPFEDANGNIGITEAKQVPFEHPKEYNRNTGETSWASGGCMFIEAELFWEVGGFDEIFFMQCDDVDISWRVRLTGKKVIYCPTALVFHDKRLSATYAQWVASEAESQYAVEAFLLMSRKWSRPDLTMAAIALYKASNNENHKKALDAYDKLKAEERLPTPIDPRHKVSEFIKFNYGKMRFTM